jgi:hypothetical protein
MSTWIRGDKWRGPWHIQADSDGAAPDGVAKRTQCGSSLADVWTWDQRYDPPVRCIACKAAVQPRPIAPSPERYFTGELRLLILERDGYRCQHCGRSVRNDLPDDDPNRANVDHIIPYPHGRTRLDNGQTLCTGCNRAKGTTMPTVASDVELEIE